MSSQTDEVTLEPLEGFDLEGFVGESWEDDGLFVTLVLGAVAMGLLVLSACMHRPPVLKNAVGRRILRPNRPFSRTATIFSFDSFRALLELGDAKVAARCGPRSALMIILLKYCFWLFFIGTLAAIILIPMNATDDAINTRLREFDPEDCRGVYDPAVCTDKDDKGLFCAWKAENATVHEWWYYYSRPGQSQRSNGTRLLDPSSSSSSSLPAFQVLQTTLPAPCQPLETLGLPQLSTNNLSPGWKQWRLWIFGFVVLLFSVLFTFSMRRLADAVQDIVTKNFSNTLHEEYDRQLAAKGTVRHPLDPPVQPYHGALKSLAARTVLIYGLQKPDDRRYFESKETFMNDFLLANAGVPAAAAALSGSGTFAASSSSSFMGGSNTLRRGSGSSSVSMHVDGSLSAGAEQLMKKLLQRRRERRKDLTSVNSMNMKNSSTSSSSTSPRGGGGGLNRRRSSNVTFLDGGGTAEKEDESSSPQRLERRRSRKLQQKVISPALSPVLPPLLSSQAPPSPTIQRTRGDHSQSMEEFITVTKENGEEIRREKETKGTKTKKVRPPVPPLRLPLVAASQGGEENEKEDAAAAFFTPPHHYGGDSISIRSDHSPFSEPPHTPRGPLVVTREDGREEGEENPEDGGDGGGADEAVDDIRSINNIDIEMFSPANIATHDDQEEEMMSPGTATATALMETEDDDYNGDDCFSPDTALDELSSVVREGDRCPVSPLRTDLKSSKSPPQAIRQMGTHSLSNNLLINDNVDADNEEPQSPLETTQIPPASRDNIPSPGTTTPPSSKQSPSPSPSPSISPQHSTGYPPTAGRTSDAATIAIADEDASADDKTFCQEDGDENAVKVSIPVPRRDRDQQQQPRVRRTASFATIVQQAVQQAGTLQKIGRSVSHVGLDVLQGGGGVIERHPPPFTTMARYVDPDSIVCVREEPFRCSHLIEKERAKLAELKNAFAATQFVSEGLSFSGLNQNRNLHDDDSDESSSDDHLPVMRPPLCCCCPFRCSKKPAIATAEKELEAIRVKLRAKLEQVKSNPFTGVVFCSFEQPWQAYRFCEEYNDAMVRYNTRAVIAGPKKYIIWRNLAVTDWHITLRLRVLFFGLMVMAFFWGIPVAMFGSIESLSRLPGVGVPFLYFRQIASKNFVKITQTYLPVIIVIIFDALLPAICRFASYIGGHRQGEGLQGQVLSFFFAFSLMEGLIVQAGFQGGLREAVNLLSDPNYESCTAVLLSICSPTGGYFFSIVCIGATVANTLKLLELGNYISVRCRLPFQKEQDAYDELFRPRKIEHDVDTATHLFFAAMGILLHANVPLMMPFTALYFFMAYLVERSIHIDSKAERQPYLDATSNVRVVEFLTTCHLVGVFAAVLTVGLKFGWGGLAFCIIAFLYSKFQCSFILTELKYACSPQSCRIADYERQMKEREKEMKNEKKEEQEKREQHVDKEAVVIKGEGTKGFDGHPSTTPGTAPLPLPLPIFAALSTSTTVNNSSRSKNTPSSLPAATPTSNGNNNHHNNSSRNSTQNNNSDHHHHHPDHTEEREEKDAPVQAVVEEEKEEEGIHQGGCTTLIMAPPADGTKELLFADGLYSHTDVEGTLQHQHQQQQTKPTTVEIETKEQQAVENEKLFASVSASATGSSPGQHHKNEEEEARAQNERENEDHDEDEVESSDYCPVYMSHVIDDGAVKKLATRRYRPLSTAWAGL